MCGFVGVWDFNRSVDPHRRFIANALVDLHRRGPDESKTWENNSTGVIFGFRRLAIRDLSSAGSQPMISRSGNLVLVLNGEVYNTDELCNWADIRSSELFGHSDTEVVLECFERKGIEATVSHLDGIFAMAVYNITEDTVTLIRDIAGVKPLYYGLCRNGLVFSSNYNHITSHNFFRNKPIFPPAVTNFFNYGFIQEGEGLIEETFFMPHCHIIKIDKGGAFKISKYKIVPTLIPDASLSELLTKIIGSQLVSDVPLGTFMSGGVDSTLTTGIAARLKKGIKCYTIGVNDELLDESIEAERFGKYFEVNHIIHSVTEEEVLNVLDQYVDSAGEPLSDFSSLITLKVCEIANKELTVCLSGDGGDELFFGYPRFKIASDAFEFLKLPRFVRLIKILLKRIQGNKVPLALMKFRKFGEYYLSKQGIPGSLYWTKRINKKRPTNSPYWYKITNDKLASQEKALQFARQLEFHIHLQRVLLKVDRASMFHSLEVRTPLLSQQLIEYSNNLKFNDCVANSTGKMPLRQVLSMLIPSDALNSGAKKGFAPPLTIWLRTSLKEKVHRRIIEIPRDLKPLMNKKVIEEMWDLHQNGRDLSWMIWSVYSLFDWVDRKMYSIDN